MNVHCVWLPRHEKWEWERAGAFWRATSVRRILAKEEIYEGCRSLRSARLTKEHREDPGSLVSSKSSPHHPSKRRSCSKGICDPQYTSRACQCCRPFSHGYRRFCNPRRTESFILPSPPKTRLPWMLPVDVLRKKWLTHSSSESAFHKWLEKSREKTWDHSREVKGKVVLLNEVCSLKYGRRHSFGIYFSSAFGSVKQLAGKI